MTTVTKRIKEVKQPRGGYINPKSMKVRHLEDGSPSPLELKAENLHAALVGCAVDYLVRLANGTAPRNAFSTSLAGARKLGPDVFWDAEDEVDGLASGRADLDDIVSACRLAGYDVAYRAGVDFYNPDARTTPDETTAEHIRVMVERSLSFFREYGPATGGRQSRVPRV